MSKKPYIFKKKKPKRYFVRLKIIENQKKSKENRAQFLLECM